MRPTPGPVDKDGRPLIVKLGTIDCDMVETTPVVWKGEVWRGEWVRKIGEIRYKKSVLDENYFRFVNRESGEVTPPFAFGHLLGSAFVDGDVAYAAAVPAWGGDRVQLFASRDLTHWEDWTAFPPQQGFKIFNTSICKADDRYVMMFEIEEPAEQAGVPFTGRFATSPDMKEWTVTPPECVYAKDRYTSPHCLRYLDGYFYDFYLEASDRLIYSPAGTKYDTRVVRSKDLIRWEQSPHNPVLRYSDEDKKIANPKLSAQERTRIAVAQDVNNSDMDFAEHEGRLIINYTWGNQMGEEFLAEAIYEGTQEQFLRGWFRQ